MVADQYCLVHDLISVKSSGLDGRKEGLGYNYCMHKVGDKQRWRQQYHATSQALEQLQARELAKMTDQKALRQIESLNMPASPWRQEKTWSGLVTQQAIFHHRKTR